MAQLEVELTFLGILAKQVKIPKNKPAMGDLMFSTI